MFTAAQKAELWERWKNGKVLRPSRGPLERRNKTGVERIVVLHGGIAPARRRRAWQHLGMRSAKRFPVALRRAGQSVRVAQGLGRAPHRQSVGRWAHGGLQGYRANQADRRTWERALRPKPCRLALHGELRWRVAQKLALQWSPEQISGWAEAGVPTDQDMQISYEAIYRSLFIQTRAC